MPYAWEPTPTDVAAVIPQRPTDANGMAGGTWTATTVPTVTQVQTLIGQRVPEVAAVVGTVPDSLVEMARGVTAVGVASYVELAFFPEQSDTGTTPAQLLWDRYEAGLRRLREAVEATGGGSGAIDSVPNPLFAFPAVLAWPCA